MKLGSLLKKDNYSALLVGKSGSGKSTAAASFIEAGNVELIDSAKRFRGIGGGIDFLGEDILTKINVELLNHGKQDAFKQLNNLLDIYTVKAKSNDLPFETLLIEDTTALAKTFMFTSMYLRGVWSEKKSSKGFEGKLRGALAFPHPDDYNFVQSCFDQLFYQHILPLKCNFLMSCWIVDEWGPDPSNEYGAPIKVGESLNMTRKLSESIPGMFDEVYLFTKEAVAGEINYYVQFESVLAKTAIPSLKGKGKVKLTGKKFYPLLQKYLKGEVT
jgi:hypothetical protein